MRGSNDRTIRTAQGVLRRQSVLMRKPYCSNQHSQPDSIDGHKFVRQVPIASYICDFVCREKLMVIEVDGGLARVNLRPPMLSD